MSQKKYVRSTRWCWTKYKGHRVCLTFEVCHVAHGERPHVHGHPGVDLEMVIDVAGWAQAGLGWPPRLLWEAGVWRKPQGGSWQSQWLMGWAGGCCQESVPSLPLTFDFDLMKGNPTLHLRKSNSSSSQEMPISSWKTKSINRWAGCTKTVVCGRSPREANPDFSRHGFSLGKFSDNGHLAALEWGTPARPSTSSTSDCTPPHSFARGSLGRRVQRTKPLFILNQPSGSKPWCSASEMGQAICRLDVSSGLDSKASKSPFWPLSPMKWSEVAQSCLTLCDPMDCSLPGSSIHGIFQARVLEWGAISFSNAHTLILSLKILAEERQMLRKSHQGKHRDSFHSLNQWGLSCLPNKPCQSWGWGQGRGGSSESRWPGLDSTDTGTRKPGEVPCRAAVFPSAPTVYNQGQRKAGGSSQPIGPLWVTEAKWRLLRGDSVCRFWNRRRHGTKLAPAECLETGALDFSEAVWLPQSRLGWL